MRKIKSLCITTAGNNLLHSTFTWLSSANARRLKSRRPFVPAAHNSSVYLITTYVRRTVWNAGWADNPRRLRISITDTGTPRNGSPRTAWVRLNRLRTGVGRFRSCLYKWGMAPSAACECCAEQTAGHVVLQCPIHRLSHGLHDLTALDDEAMDWLLNTCPKIWYGLAVGSNNSLKRRRRYDNYLCLVASNN